MKHVAREVVWEGEMFDVAVERWGDDVREIAEHPGSVTIVPIDTEGRIVLIRQFRPAVRATLLELPAGMLDEGEDFLAGARRELAEETGLHGGTWRHLRTIHPSPGFVREAVDVFLAEDLEEGERDLDEGEQLELVRLTPAELSDVLDTPDGIADAKTLAGLFLYFRL